MAVVRGRDIIPIPNGYYEEFRRDPLDAMLKYGSAPMRSAAPWFTNVKPLDEAMRLPDQVCGSGSVLTNPKLAYRSLEGSSDEMRLLDGIAPGFRAWDEGFWHVHVDLALNKKRHGDAAGIAMGRIADSFRERAIDPLQNAYERIVRHFEIPLVAQIVAPSGDQIYISSVTRLILQLKQLRGFNITSFSFDGFQSADAMQQLALAGLVTAGMKVEDDGSVTGMPKKFSVDGGSDQPYRELLEAVNEARIALPRYLLLRKELVELEVVAPGQAPDHQVGGSKDTADPVAGVVGYLSAFGHAMLGDPLEGRVLHREDLEQMGAVDRLPVAAQEGFGVDNSEWDWDAGVGSETLTFAIE